MDPSRVRLPVGRKTMAFSRSVSPRTFHTHAPICSVPIIPRVSRFPAVSAAELHRGSDSFGSASLHGDRNRKLLLDRGNVKNRLSAALADGAGRQTAHETVLALDFHIGIGLAPPLELHGVRCLFSSPVQARRRPPGPGPRMHLRGLTQKAIADRASASLGMHEWEGHGVRRSAIHLM